MIQRCHAPSCAFLFSKCHIDICHFFNDYVNDLNHRDARFVPKKFCLLLLEMADNGYYSRCYNFKRSKGVWDFSFSTKIASLKEM